jgi:oligopeptide transport system permease protein
MVTSPTRAVAGQRSLLLEREKRTFWSDAAHRFLSNRLAIVGCGLVIFLVLMAISAPWVTPQSYDEVHFEDAWLFPSSSHWMGTDGLGRDFFSRVVFGARIALAVGLMSQSLAFAIGIPLGVLAGFQGGRIDFAIMRLVDVAWALPRMLLAVLIMAVLGPGFKNVLLAIGITGWVPLCRLARAQVLKEKEQDYITASRAVGARGLYIVLRHMLPNVFAPLIVALTLGIPEAIFAEAGLSFLGLGVNPPMPSWGRMVGDSINHIRYFWHLAFFPALMIAITMFAFTLAGDGLRDALDVRMTR